MTGVTFVVARHGQRADGFDVKPRRYWINSDPPPERPWNPPLTPLGERQGTALGHHVREALAAIGRGRGAGTAAAAPILARCYVSPLIRCVTTAACALAAYGEGAPKMRIENGVVEYLEQQWFHLWRCNSEDHEYASTNVATLFPKVQEAVEEGGKHGVGVDTGYASFIDMHRFGYSFNDRIETWEDLRSRVRSFIVEMQRRHNGETVMVVTHGAVVSAFIDELVPSLSGMKHDVRYASLSIFSPDPEEKGDVEKGDVGSYFANVLCDHTHTDNLCD